MCKVSQVLSYGILVRVTFLCIAAKQWRVLNPTLLALDLITMRKLEGTLEVGQDEGALVELPVEVLDMIKAFTVDAVASEVEDAFVRELHERGVETHGDLGSPPDVSSVNLTYQHFEQCYHCQRGVHDSVTLFHTYANDIDELLAHFDLAIQLEQCYSWSECATSEPFALFLLVLQPEDEEDNAGMTSTIIDINHGHLDSAQKIRYLAPSFFILPANADKRFRALLRSGLTVVTGSFASTGRRLNRDGTIDDDADAPEQTSVDSAADVVSSDVPQWLMWPGGQDCDPHHWG